MKKLSHWVFKLGVLLCLGSSLQAFSMIHGGLSGGYRGALGENIGSTPEIRAFLHVNPITVIPASLGFSYAYMAPIDVPGKKKVEIGELALEVSAWSPVSVWSISPYIRARIPFYTYFTGRHAAGLEAKAFTGFHGHVGFRWDFLPMFALFLEGGMGANSYELEGKKLGSFANVLMGVQVLL